MTEGEEEMAAAAAAACGAKDPEEGSSPPGGPSALNRGSAGAAPRKPRLPPPPKLPQPSRRPAGWPQGHRPEPPFKHSPSDVLRTGHGPFTEHSLSTLPPNSLLYPDQDRDINDLCEIPNPDLHIVSPNQNAFSNFLMCSQNSSVHKYDLLISTGNDTT